MLHSPIHTLKAHFPQCFDKNGDLMPHKLQEAILDLAQESTTQQNTPKQKDKARSDIATDFQEKDAILSLSKETYTLNWLGKSYAKLLRHLPTNTLIAQDLSHNTQAEHKNSKNVLIKGDNLEVLKHLKNAYYNKIKMIYIDPPYNTGKDGFIYNDERNFTPQSLAQMANIELDEANKILNYTLKNSSTHSAWLSFMYPRLYIARQLLRDDGVIFISIDDNEQANLKILCDEIFGEENFISYLPRITIKGGKTQTNLFTNNIDYILCYAKKIDNVSFEKISMVGDSAFKYSDKYENERGKYHTKQALDTSSLGYVPSLDYPIIHNKITYYPGGTKENNGFRWTWSKDLYDFAIKNDFVEFKNSRIFPKKYELASIEGNSKSGYFIDYKEKQKNYSQITFIDNEFSNRYGDSDLESLNMKKIFSYPKPTNLIKQLLKIATTPHTAQNGGGGGDSPSPNSARELDSTHSIHPLAPSAREGEHCSCDATHCHTERSEVSQNDRDFSHSSNAQNDRDISLDAQYDKDRDISFATQTQYDNNSNDNEPDIILDFFAGSGTTAHAVMELNAQDNGNRQFILVQLDEKIDSAKSKVAYDFCKNELGSENPTIFDITKERIKRVSAKIAQSKTHPLAPSAREREKECGNSANDGKSLDLGFKIYEIRHNDLQSNDDSLFDSIKLSDDDKNALLESFRLQDSLPLSVQNHRVDLGGYEGILVGEKLYLLNPHFEAKHLQNLIEKIDTQKDFVIKEISYLNNVFDSARIREIEEGITTYANKKGLKILVRARFI